jgi:hypothetical protein
MAGQFLSMAASGGEELLAPAAAAPSPSRRPDGVAASALRTALGSVSTSTQ